MRMWKWEDVEMLARSEVCMAFAEVQAKPAITHIDKQNANDRLKKLIAETTALFVNHIDNFVKMMAAAQPAFYDGYKNARVIGGNAKASNDPPAEPGTP